MTDTNARRCGATAGALLACVVLGSPTLLAVDSRQSGADCGFSQFAPIVVSQFVKATRVSGSSPEYPTAAIERNIQGHVLAQILISPDGRVERVCTEGAGEFRPAVEKALKTWRFRRGKRRPGGVRYVVAPVDVTFSLEHDRNGRVVGRVKTVA